jgi:NAD(P)-dependent dehydrogenase (short-subunit alcohol dehydrogenase family)
VEIAGGVAVVTGAAAGAGREIALRLADEGALVVVADVDAVRGEAVAAEIGRGARFVHADIRATRDVQHMVGSAGERLRILVNNAGGGGHVEPHFPMAEPEEWGATLDLNLRGAMLATQFALEQMARGGGGAIVNIASTAGLGLEPYHSPEYAAAKAGLIRFTSALAGLGERMRVRVSCVVPDWIETERAREELARMTSAQRAATPAPLPPNAVPDAVVALARDDEAAGRVVVLRPGEPPRVLT